MWLMLSATSLVMPTCSWESVGFIGFALGVSSCCEPLCRSAGSDRWGAWVSAAGCSRVLPCPKRELLSCSWCICKGHFSTNFTHSEWECIPAGRSNHSEGSFWQLCACIAPGPTRGMEGQCCSAGTCSHAQLVDGPRQLAATLFFFPNR